MTSLAWYPFAMSEGASGAIFGLYGALLALFLSRRQTVPAETWARRPKVMAALVGCSLLYGLFGREINVAADTYDDLKEYGKAITDHTEAIRLDPNNPVGIALGPAPMTCSETALRPNRIESKRWRQRMRCLLIDPFVWAGKGLSVDLSFPKVQLCPGFCRCRCWALPSEQAGQRRSQRIGACHSFKRHNFGEHPAQ
jgi:Rhomboid family